MGQEFQGRHWHGAFEVCQGTTQQHNHLKRIRLHSINESRRDSAPEGKVLPTSLQSPELHSMFIL